MATEDDVIALLAIYVCTEDDNIKKRKKRKQRFWMKEWYKQRPEFSHVKLLRELENNEKDDFFNFLRVDAATYQELLSFVRPIIQKQDTLMRNAITPHERLSATLRFLASGGSYQSLKFLTSISPQSLGYIVMETCDAIIKTLKQYIQVIYYSEIKKKTKLIHIGQ